MKARVGGGVSVAGMRVKVGAWVGRSMAVSSAAPGWNGVGVDKAFGSAVTSIGVGGSVLAEGKAHDVRESKRKIKVNRTGDFIQSFM